MKLLYSAGSDESANGLREVLAANGIGASVETVVGGPHDGATAASFNVFVEETDYERAAELLWQFAPQPDVVPKTKLRLWCEVVLILVLTQPFFFPPGIILRYTLVPYIAPTFFAHWLYSTTCKVVVAGIALGMMWWSGEPWSVFGIKRPKWSVDLISAGIITWIDRATSYVGGDLVRSFLIDLLGADRLRALTHYREWLQRPEGLSGVMALLVFAFAVGLAEELVSRGFLISRFDQLFHSRVASVLLSAVLFGLFHWYNGPVSVSGATLTGVVYGTAFVLLGRLWPVVIAHALVDFHGFLYNVA